MKIWDTIFRPIYVAQIPNKSASVHVNVYSNKLKVVQNRDRKRYADVACYGLYDQKKMPEFI